jgi:peptidoglycan/xylan/chitin deacetylase (PgdA/CDA1 family)
MWPGSFIFSLGLVLLLGGCVGTLHPKSDLLLPPLPMPDVTKSAPPEAEVVKTDEYVIVIAKPGDTLRSLAQRFLGDAAQYWLIADFNDFKQLTPGQEVVIPLKATNPLGVYASGYQTVPILSYHRFEPDKSRLVVTPQAFAAQMAYLKAHDYRVIPLTDLIDFLQGHKPLPRRAVVITIDDGFKSAYTIAYPILQHYGFPATIFVYSDFIGSAGGLSWQEMRDMVASHLIDIQPHSKSHMNLGLIEPTEDDATSAQWVEREIHFPARQIQQHLKLPIHTFAYPYGDTNDFVIARLQAQHYQMGVTVERGGNPFFTDPFLLRRTMIYGDESLEDFIDSLEVFRKERLL